MTSLPPITRNINDIFRELENKKREMSRTFAFKQRAKIIVNRFSELPIDILTDCFAHLTLEYEKNVAKTAANAEIDRHRPDDEALCGVCYNYDVELEKTFAALYAAECAAAAKAKC